MTVTFTTLWPAS